MRSGGPLTAFPDRQCFRPLDDDHRNSTLHGYVDRVIERFPDKLAVADGTIEYTYRALGRRSNRIARSLLAARADGVVAILLPNCADLVPVFLGVLRAGCTAAAIDPSLPAERVRFLLSDSRASAAVTTTGHLTAIATDLTIDLPTVLLDADVDGHPCGPLDAPGDVHAPATLIYTSGSTGTPKGIAHTHHAWMVATAEDVVRRQTTAADRHSQMFSSSSSTALFTLVIALLTGASIHPYDAGERKLVDFLDWIRTERITELRIAATTFRQVFSAAATPTAVASVRTVTVGGEVMHRTDLDLFERWFPVGAHMRLGWASSETLFSSNCYLGHGATVSDDEGLPAGYAYDFAHLEIHDDSGRPVGPNVTGELVVSGPAVATGYWHRADLSDNFSADPHDPHGNVYRTGDLATLSEDGMLRLAGRKDHMVKIRGHRVELDEVDARLLELQGVRQACAVARRDHNGTDRLVAYLVAEPGPVPSIRTLHTQMARRLPTAMLPSRYVFLDRLPTNPTGKVDRAELPPPFNERPALETPLVAPVSDLEIGLAAIWSEVLGLDEIGLDDDFLLLGGDSLGAAQVFLLIEDSLGWRLPPSLLLESGTVRSLAQQIEVVRHEADAPFVELRSGEPDSPTLVLFAPFGGSVIFFRELLTHLPHSVRVIGVQSWTADLAAMRKQSVDDIVDGYLPFLRATQPTGPYFLGGFSFGGLLAYQMAARLAAGGEPIGFVALFDTFGPGETIAGDGRALAVSRHHLEQIRGARSTSAKLGLAARLPGLATKKIVRSARALMRRRHSDERFRQVHSTTTTPPYFAPDLDADVYLFRSTARTYLSHVEPETLGWNTVVTGALHLVDVDGDHVEVVRGENARRVGTTIAAAIDRYHAP
jgi:amino acid adenylation domain-containing protein